MREVSFKEIYRWSIDDMIRQTVPAIYHAVWKYSLRVSTQENCIFSL